MVGLCVQIYMYAQFSPSKLTEDCKRVQNCPKSQFLFMMSLFVVHGVSHGVSHVVGHRVSLGAGLGCPHMFGHYSDEMSQGSYVVLNCSVL